MVTANGWKDYALLDTGEGVKLERWGEYTLARPDPQIIWPRLKEWKRVDAYYERSKDGGGRWIEESPVAKQWKIKWKDLTFITKLMGFKHTGVFPEQAANWEWMMKRIGGYKGKFSVLNLFGYTGGATLACAKAGASVVHVDASKGMTMQCKENAKLSGLGEARIRYIVDDAFKFVEREIRRGNTYQGIIMDPPSYGRGPNGQVWKLESSVYDLVESCTKLMDRSSDFMLINSYTTGLQPTVMANILKMTVKFRGNVTADEIGLVQEKSDIILPCGCFARWEAK